MRYGFTLLIGLLCALLALSGLVACGGGGADSDADGDTDGDSDTDGDADTDSDGDSDTDSDSDGDTDADGDTDVDGDTDTDSDSDGDVVPPTCDPGDECDRDSDCGDTELCANGRCEPAYWPMPPICETEWERCVQQSQFPDPCYAEGVPAECPSRDEALRAPACFSFLELGAPGPEDDALVLRRLYDLWSRGQGSAEPPRPKVVMAVGDSISETWAYISADAFDCMLPDFDFNDGYRLVGQPGIFDLPQTAATGQEAGWGLQTLQSEPWWPRMRPEVATVAFGTNELWSGWQGLDEFVTNMRGIVDELLERNVVPILVTIPPGTYDISRGRYVCGGDCTNPTSNYETEDFAQAVRDLAAERLLPLVDVHRRMMDFDRPGYAALLSDGVHPCRCAPGSDNCPDPDCAAGTPMGGTYLRNDAVLRMYKYLERTVMTRCPGSSAPPTPAGYSWNDDDVLSNFRGAAPLSYCPDPHIDC